ncbi:Pr6Pr family membrane protein [Arcicella aquatica]|uniref:Pr6Pr family membrane protein n=1 Tax=Arcicella aquatica TaxID=217141 RepID=A0ABU5QMH6_9BACT|nr:Pr6Pr family membrane protein [Arcicella aquatica]MEA5258255.1 Pr6Pr family membrane protein [Arcicella aquatica]
MKISRIPSKKIFLIFLVLLGWFALILQYYVLITNKKADISELTIRFFSYFTVLSNLLVSMSATVLLLKPNIALTNFLSLPKTLTATTVYIVIVSIIYNTMLRFIWHPEGLLRVADELLHLIIPLIFFIYWLVYVKKDELQWSDFLPWLIFPFLYMIFILLSGAFSGFYPYPFFNVIQLGYLKVIINASFITLVFIMVSFLFIGIGKLMTRNVALK